MYHDCDREDKTEHKRGDTNVVIGLGLSVVQDSARDPEDVRQRCNIDAFKASDFN